MNLPDDFVATPEFQKFKDTLFDDSMPVFITGNAGTGKSTFLQYFLENCLDDTPVILAPTGVAAVNVGGATIHSFFKFPPRYIHLDSVRADYRWQGQFSMGLQTIIIDEISMVRADMIDNIDIFLRKNLHKDIPFGGVKIIMIGDLHQLPPIVEPALKKFYDEIYTSPYFFDAKVWDEITFETLELTHIFRQKDPEFINVLNHIRRGSLPVSVASILNTRVHRTLTGNVIDLTTTNKNADAINEVELAKILELPHRYTADIKGDFPTKYFPTSEHLNLKVGAQVMMLRNGPGYYNGTIGKVCEMEDNGVWVEVELDDERTRKLYITPVEFERIEYESIDSKIHGKGVGTFTQLPIKLAWAITMHKSQGMTFDKVRIDFGFGSFAHGQTYVALSRCRTLEGISLKRRISPRDIMFDSTVLRVKK